MPHQSPVPAVPVPPAVPTEWFRGHTTELTTLDPSPSLDDLEPLREVIGSARVVAVGENAHFVEEFSGARQRLLRFLAERCGFTVFALELGFGEAFPLDRWLHGEGEDNGLEKASKAAAEWGSANLMHWLRRHNRTSGHPLGFAAIDIPEAGGALRPALDPVAVYLREVDPELLPVLETALEISDRFLDGVGSGAAAAPAWAALDTAEQDALTAALARLLLRFRAAEPLYVSRSGRSRFDVALRQVEGACHTDHMFQAMNDLMNGRAAATALSVREIYMAESVRWHLDHAEPGARIVLAAHNNHIQKTAVHFGGTLTGLPMGQHLHRMLGQDYRSVALTHTADHVPEMYPDQVSRVGFTLAEARLGPPGPGSVEAALTDAGLGDAITLTGLRRSPHDAQGPPVFTSIRTQSAAMSTPVPEAFDAVLSVPTVTRDRSVRF